MAATCASPASSDIVGRNASFRWGAAAVAAAALLVFTNGPVLLFSKHVLDRTGRWEDHAVWPLLAAAALCGAGLAAGEFMRSRAGPTDTSSRAAVAAVGAFTLAAVASTLWSVDPQATAWRSCIYVGMALLAWGIARLDAAEAGAVLAAVAGAAVAASLILVWLRPDLGLHADGSWKGVYTNRNSLGPLAAIGVLVSVRYLVAPGRLRRAASAVLAAASMAAMVGAGSRTAWISLAVAMAAATLLGAYHWLRRRGSAARARTATLTAATLGAVGAAAAAALLWDVPTFAQRREIWGLVWDRIVQRPLHGYGFFTFWDIDELTQHVLLRRGSAHNSLVEVALGLGLLGAVPFTVIVLLAARNTGLAVWRRPSPDTWMGAAVVAFLLVENLTESFVLWFSYSWVLLMAAALKPAQAADLPAAALPDAGADPPPQGPDLSQRVQRMRQYVSERLAVPSNEETTAAVERTPARGLCRLRSGWVAVALMVVAMLALWTPDLDLPLGNSDDGRIVAFSGLHARNFWDLGPVESAWGARIDPFVRPEFGVSPRSDPPVEALTYAHHPPLKDFLSIASAGLLGDSLPALRIPAFLLGAATLAFMASLLRGCSLRWGPVLLSVGAMACTGFFYVYGRLGVSFSLMLASAAAVAWLRRLDRPPVWALAGTAALAALTATLSWIALASLGPLAVWLYAARLRGRADRHAIRPIRREAVARAARERSEQEREWHRHTATGSHLSAWRLRRGDRSDRLAETRSAGPRPPLAVRLAGGLSPALTALVVGAAVGAAVTAAWLLNATGFAELSNQVDVRVSSEVASGSQTIDFSFGEFLSRQWRYASEELLFPTWLRVLLVPALIAGLVDRRTRVATAITLAAAAAMTFGLQQGAWIHRLWNFPWLMPMTVGLASLLDAARRMVSARLRPLAALAAAAVIGATLLAVVAGGTRDRYISDPARLGEALEQAAATPQADQAELVWTGPGLPAPRWASYYLDLPVWDLEESRLAELADSDLVIVRASRTPDFFADGALDDPLAAAGDFRVVTAASLVR